MKSQKIRSLRRDKRAISPAFSTVILTAAGIVLILVAMNFANNTLNTQMAANEFNSNQQFMQTTGLQIDDIAWTIGRTQTVTYSSKFGFLNYNESALDYTVQVYSNSTLLANFTSPATGIIQYKIPIDAYSLGNNYFERVPFSCNGSFLQTGSSAPVTQVFCMEKLLNNQTNYAQIVLVPTIRMLNSSVTGLQTTNYLKFYMPYLINGGLTYSSSPSVTLTGENVSKTTETCVTRIVITVSPNAKSGFTSSFFNFPTNTITLNMSNSVVEFYYGEVQVTEGNV